MARIDHDVRSLGDDGRGHDQPEPLAGGEERISEGGSDGRARKLVPALRQVFQVWRLVQSGLIRQIDPDDDQIERKSGQIIVARFDRPRRRPPIGGLRAAAGPR
jgi:hypothetical protein